ncbi:hypothetical protein F8388_000320 [Cannabis sativa]|uniref:Luc7-like protein 3 n=1 Tax=Cannabis sativa TaxID=3483 RepID=A0A7J6FN42_CANSA|nr:hypothetical protein F8388_000320 [Cannabis sativa]
MDAQRALLDELMGAARNMTDEERKGFKEVTWDDKEVCGAYMVRFCPHDLFVNTRSDLGPCPRIHDPKLKESFEKSPRHDAFVPKFETELAQFCEKLVMDLDRRVRRGRERLAQEVEPAPAQPLSSEKAEQLSQLEDKIKNLLEQVESLGEAGKVDEAEALMRKVPINHSLIAHLLLQTFSQTSSILYFLALKFLTINECITMRFNVVNLELLFLLQQVDTLNTEKAALTQQTLPDKVLLLAQEKKMALCEICGSFLVANDAVERTQSHITGKQHIGYGMVRDFISEYKLAKEKGREEERLAREKETEERRKQREKELDSRRRSVSGDRDRHRDRERERDRYRDRDLDRERSRDWNGRGNRDGGRSGEWRSRNGRDGARDRNRDRSRSRSPVRHGHRRSPRSPVHPY